jgi:hypothetical protein
VIRIFVDHDLFTVPQPIIGKAIVFGCNAEIEAIEPETVPTAAREAEDMASPKAAGEPPVFPGAIKMEAGIITARVMADPLIIRVNVRGFRMAWPVRVVALRLGSGLLLATTGLFGPSLLLLRPGLLLGTCLLLGWCLMLGLCGRRSMSGNMSAPDFSITTATLLITAVVLRGSSYTRYQGYNDKCRSFAHIVLLIPSCHHGILEADPAHSSMNQPGCPVLKRNIPAPVASPKIDPVKFKSSLFAGVWVLRGGDRLYLSPFPHATEFGGRVGCSKRLARIQL